MVDHGVPQILGPFEVLVHQIDDFRIVEQPEHAGIPVFIGLEGGILLLLLQKPRGRDYLQRIGRCRQDDSHQFVGVKRDGPDQFLELLRRKVAFFGRVGLTGNLGLDTAHPEQDHKHCKHHAQPGSKNHGSKQHVSPLFCEAMEGDRIISA
jgi:hypothetical protein